jgi:Gas vesicle synthesis protein GvpL/GvpF
VTDGTVRPTDPLYVLALLDERIRAPRGSGIAIVGVAGLFAAVRKTPGAPGLSEAALREQHRIVLNLGEAARAILPVRFGTVVNRDSLEQTLRAGRAVLQEAFATVRDREQMTVRVFGSAPPRPAASAAGSGTEYLLARAAHARPQLPSLALGIVRAVAPLARAERVDPGQREVQVALHHLVDRGRASEYRALVASAVGPTVPSSSVVISGPWPPFAFVPDLWPTPPAPDSLAR